MSIRYSSLSPIITNFKIILFLLFLAWFSMAMSSPVVAQVDMSNSFMQVLDSTKVRLRNIKTGQGILKQSYSIGANGPEIIPESPFLEGTNQRKYVINDRTITIDGSKQDWNGIAPAFTDPQGDSTDTNPATNSGTDLKGIYLAKDQNFLYVLITLYGPPVANGTVTYFFQARLLPEDDSFSYFAGAPLVAGPSPVTLSLHFKPKITTPINSSQPPLATILKTYPQFAAHGYEGGEGVVEFKVPLSDFPLEAIVGRYVDAWVEAPPYPSREDTTASQEGVYMEINTTVVPAVNLLLQE
jgi:hypothetical protein